MDMFFSDVSSDVLGLWSSRVQAKSEVEHNNQDLFSVNEFYF